MGTIDQNRDVWATYAWPRQGDEWSSAWGGAAAEWYGTLLPRLRHWLPARTVLEIAPGFGRWTQFLKDLAEHLILVDVTERCILECRTRFASATNISYHVNDGRSLSMVENGSLNLVFSFDSLVHAEADVIEAYLLELAKKLAPDGVGFIHHSNIGAYPTPLLLGRWLRRLTTPFARHPAWLPRTRFIEPNRHWRATSMTAALFATLCRTAGLQCRTQELITWESGLLTDCISVFTRADSRFARVNHILENQHFMAEAAYIASRERLYAPQSRVGFERATDPNAVG